MPKKLLLDTITHEALEIMRKRHPELQISKEFEIELNQHLTNSYHAIVDHIEVRTDEK